MIKKRIGFIKGLWVYPVKSMLGKSRAEVFLEPRGIVGDRLYAVRDELGKFGSGKNTRRFCKIDGLFNFKAHFEGEVPQITFPSGEIIGGKNPSLHSELSRVLGKKVALAREQSISHFDAGAVHILTTASLNWLKFRLPKSIMDERRFRPNVLIEAHGNELLEQNWLGKILKLGENVELEITQNTERCIMTTFAQDFLPEDKRIFTLLGRKANLNFGVYAKVICGGRVAQNDDVFIE
jgi:uncharacterized protein YcbX